jgi:hypothetical protein
MPLASSIGLMQELRQYLTEEVVFVPDLERDADVDRLEKPASSLDTMIWQMRLAISHKLADARLGDANTMPEVPTLTHLPPFFPPSCCLESYEEAESQPKPRREAVQRHPKVQQEGFSGSGLLLVVL